MKSRNTEETQRILMLLKIDANNVYRRIKDRKSEYLEIFALRRTREHFPKIFNNRYEGTTLQDLAHCSTDLITTLDQFYSLVEDMSWYLFQTEDMPNTVDDYINRKIIKMGKLLGTLNLFLDAELGISTDASPDLENASDFLPEAAADIFSEPVSEEPQEN